MWDTNTKTVVNVNKPHYRHLLSIIKAEQHWWFSRAQRHCTLVWAAQALASKVFPVPGGPYMSTPFGGWMPRFSNFSLWFMGRTIASTSCKEKSSELSNCQTVIVSNFWWLEWGNLSASTSWICLSRPPMSLYCSVGLSSTSMALTLESYSVGRVSKIR